MKIVSFIILAFINISVFGQSVEFKLYLSSDCNDSIIQADYYEMQNINDSTEQYKSDSIGMCILPDTGYYKILIVGSFAEHDRYIHINNRVNQSYTIKAFSINECYNPTTRPDFYGYCCCGEKCEGLKVDYYSNGKKRIEGKFKDGKPIGELKFYYPSGNLKRVENYNEKGEKRAVFIYKDAKSDVIRY